MAKKRPEFTFPELEHRGRNAILRSTEEVRAEEELLGKGDETASESTQAAETPSTQGRETNASVRARTRASKPVAVPAMADRLRQKLRTKQHLSSYTFRFRPEELEQLDQLVAELNQSRTSKLSKNDLARLAVSWLLADYEERGQASLIVEVTSRE
jgi:hypothetical protein